MPETKVKKNLQYRPDDEMLRKFQAAQNLLGINQTELVKHCIEFTLKHIAEHPDEYIAERRRVHEEALHALDRDIEELREIFTN